MFDLSDDFYQLNAGAHRRRATNFRAPALTWHRAFWVGLPSSQDVPEVEAEELERRRQFAVKQCKSLVDDFIVAFRRFLIARAPHSDPPTMHPTVGRKVFLFEKVVDSTGFNPVANDNAKLTKAEKDVLYSDARVVVMEFDWDGMAGTIRLEFHTEYFTITTFAQLGPNGGGLKQYAELVDYLNTVSDQPSADDVAKAERLRKFFFFDFWQERMKSIGEGGALEKIMSDPRFNNIFADFCGMVISNKTWRLDEAPVFNQSSDLSWGKRIDFKLLPLFAEFRNYECAASYMLDGRALYMSTLGPQQQAVDQDAAKDGKGLHLSPLQYIFYVHELDHTRPEQTVVSKWQLGRLIDRIHLLGTVRLAALKYLPQLRQVGDGLSGLDAHLKKARHEQTGGISNPDLQSAHRHFGGIATEFNKETRTDSGIFYRIERSRYYIEQFNTNVKTLRIGRLEGYQRYDEFVEHRLGPAFDFINRLGIRYGRAVNVLSSFDQYSLSVRTQQIDDDIRRGQDDIKKIQIYGEAVLGGVLVPYYLIGLASHVLVCDEMKKAAIGLFTLGIGYAFLRIAAFKKKKLVEQIFAVCAGLLAVTLIVLVLYAAGWIAKDDSAACQSEHAGPANPVSVAAPQPTAPGNSPAATDVPNAPKP